MRRLDRTTARRYEGAQRPEAAVGAARVVPEGANTLQIAERFTRGAMIGRGANASVYRAFDRELARDVALKAFDSRGGDALFRLKSEFRALRGISHPNLVQLYELVVTPEQAFFTMELVEDAVDVLGYVRAGLGAGEALDHGGIERLRATFAQVFDGLLALHRAGLLHRDLKPSNMLVAPGGRAVLLDFGLAASRSAGGATAPGEFAGTPAYAAPELFRGEGSSPATDAFAAGVLLFETLTGLEPTPEHHADWPRALEHARGGTSSRETPRDLVELAASLLADSPRERATIEQVRQALEAGEPQTTAAPARIDTPFVGRRAELDWLAERIGEARTGAAVLAVVHGESGIGKTELVRRFLESESARDALVLSGACRPREWVAYNALDGPTDQLSTHLLHERAGRDLSGDAVDALLRLFPVLERVPALLARRRPAPSLSPREVARRAFAALGQILREIGARRPVVLWIDDAQWGDHDSALALHEVLPQRGLRLLLLLTCRPDRDAGIVGSLLDSGARVETLRVGPLDAGECRELVTLLAATTPTQETGAVADARKASDLDAVATLSEGSPFVLQELASQLGRHAAPLSGEALARATVARIDETAPGARSVARVIALGGAGLRVQEILSLADAAPSEALLYRMQELRLLRPSVSRASGLEIYHDRIRDAVLESMPSEEQRTWHRRIAAAVRSRAVPDAAMLVEHYMGGEERGEASHWAVVAAEDAERVLAFARAAELYALALELRERGAEDWALSARLGQARSFAGDRVGGGRLLDEAASHSERYGASKTETLRLRTAAARELLCGGEVDGGLDALRRMVSLAGFRYPKTPRHALLELLVLRARLALRGFSFRERSESEIAPETLEKLDACWTGILGLNSFDAIRSGTYQARHTLLALDAGEPRRVARAFTLEVAFRAVEGSESGRRKAWQMLERVDELARRLDDPRTTAFAHLCASVAHYFAAQWPAAFERAAAGDEVFARLPGTGWERTMCRMYRLWSNAWSGDVASLRREQAAALEAAAASEDWLDGIIAASGHANLPWLFDDDPAEARRRAEQAIGRFPEIGFQSPHYADLVAQTRIDLYEDTPWRAWARIEQAWPRLRAAQILRLQLFRIELGHLRALAALAAARAAKTARENAPETVSERVPRGLAHWTPARLRRLAAGEARRLRREDIAVAGALAACVEAGLARSATGARERLDAAAHGFSRAGAGLYAELVAATAAGHGVRVATDIVATATDDAAMSAADGTTLAAVGKKHGIRAVEKLVRTLLPPLA